MIEALISVRLGVGDLALAGQWYVHFLDVQTEPTSDSVLRYRVDSSWLELVEAHTAPNSMPVYWGVDSLASELLRLHAAGIRPLNPPAVLDSTTRTAIFIDPFGNAVGLMEVDDPNARRARAHRAAEKIALRNVRSALDELNAEDRQQRKASLLVATLVAVVIVLGFVVLQAMLRNKPQEQKIVIPLAQDKLSP
jgi:hypothetical protein